MNRRDLMHEHEGVRAQRAHVQRLRAAVERQRAIGLPDPDDVEVLRTEEATLRGMESNVMRLEYRSAPGSCDDQGEDE